MTKPLRLLEVPRTERTMPSQTNPDAGSVGEPDAPAILDRADAVDVVDVADSGSSRFAGGDRPPWRGAGDLAQVPGLRDGHPTCIKDGAFDALPDWSAEGAGRRRIGAPTASEAVREVAAPLRRATIHVHGYPITVDYDPSKSDLADVAQVERALNRYPPAWIHGAHARAGETNEPFPSIRLVGPDRFPDGPDMADSDALYGFYERGTNTIHLNVDLIGAYAGTPDHEQRMGDPGWADPNALLGTNAIHEFAHYLDDAGLADVALGNSSIDKATDVAKARLRTEDGAPRGTTEPGAFRARIEARNASTDPQDYISVYDRSSRRPGLMPDKVGETFAEIVTQAVLGGPEAREALRQHPTTGGAAGQVLDYLDSGLDADALTYDRAAGESAASRVISDEALPRYDLLSGIDAYMEVLNIERTPAREAHLRRASVSELEQLRDHLDAHGRWPDNLR